MLIIGFIDRLGQFLSRLTKRQWSEWEIIAIAAVIIIVMLWIINRIRKRAFRNIYDNQFLESTPVIGAKLGARKKRRQLIRNFKKSQIAAARSGHINKKKSEQKSETEKLHEEIRQLQKEILKHKKSEVRLEEEVAYLTSTNEKLQLEITELKKAGQTDGLKSKDESSSEKQCQSEIPATEQTEPQVAKKAVASESEQIKQTSEEQNVEVPVDEKNVERAAPNRGRAYEDTHRIVDDVKQKLCRKCNEWKPESDFHKNTSSKDGLAGSCKKCTAEAAKEYRKRRKAAQE